MGDRMKQAMKQKLKAMSETYALAAILAAVQSFCL